MTDERYLQVYLHNKPIGTLSLMAGDQTIFAFEEDYINNPQRDTLSLSFKSLQGGLITDIRPSRARLPTFFSNLLPEGPLREYLAKKIGVSEKREFFLIRELGLDLPGAVTIEAFNEPLQHAPDEKHKSATQESPDPPLRFSLAGVQLKLSAIKKATGGLTIPTEGKGGSWIVKLPSMTFKAVPENEFHMMHLADQVGITVAETELIPVDKISGLPVDFGGFKGNALAVKRFDRTEEEFSIHMEDFAQIFRVYPEKKYDKANYKNIAEVIFAESGLEDALEFVRRLVFNALIGNGDMHLKNWSLIYPDRKHARLSPAYDLLSTIPYIKDAKTALNLVSDKEMASLSIDQLSHFAAKARLPEKPVLQVARETIEKFLMVWRNGEYLQDMDVIRDAINQHIKTIRLVHEVQRA